ncbi:MAG: MBL fold metallo-hydrolase [Ruminococcaceae bacterium]|nr:MBL fold metallo-hydrolase [Oscillospiraceae bacterium]
MKFWTYNVWILLLTLMVLLSSCNTVTAPPNAETGSGSESVSESESTSESRSDTTENESESKSESQSNTQNDSVDPPIKGKLPTSVTRPPEYMGGDGLKTRKYLNQTETDYELACLYFEQNGYTRYCGRDTENTRSATYTKNDAYATLFFRRKRGDLTVGRADHGALVLPPQNEPYESLRETTFTQPGLSGEGMCEILQLADGSFLIFDSGTSSAGVEIYRELCRLSGKTTDIHIRAWVLTHSHSDHYGGFLAFFSEGKYKDAVKVDYILYAPINRSVADKLLSYNTSWDSIDYYFCDAFPTYIKNRLPKTKLCAVHAGQTFTFADVELQILYTSEYLYIDSVPINFNNTSIISRVENKDGSVLIMGDSGENATDWALQTYGTEELKSDMMQVTHHGMVTGYDERMMVRADPDTYFWPCSENKFNLYWGLSYTAKQYAISNAENITHGYGSATRKLSYRGRFPDGMELLTPEIAVNGNGVTFIPTDAKSIQFTVNDATDPYITLPVSFSAAQYNAVRIRVRCPDYKTSTLSWTAGSQMPFAFSAANQKKLGPQGAGKGNIVTLLVYLGNGSNYTGTVTSLRLDLGEAVGDTVTVFSIEAFHIDIDQK